MAQTPQRRSANGTATASWIIVAYHLQVWGSDGWEVCRQTDYHYEQNAVGPVLDRTYLSPPCGAGYYRTNGYAHRWTGSEWRGGSMTSPSTYVPRS